MPDPRTVELARALYETVRPLNGGTYVEWADLPGDSLRNGYLEWAERLSERFIIVPADTARTGWLYPEDGSWTVYPSGNPMLQRVIVAPDPRTEATDE